MSLLSSGRQVGVTSRLGTCGSAARASLAAAGNAKLAASAATAASTMLVLVMVLEMLMRLPPSDEGRTPSRYCGSVGLRARNARQVSFHLCVIPDSSPRQALSDLLSPAEASIK